MPQHINKCRRLVTALALLWALCASACTGSQEGGPQGENTSATPVAQMPAEGQQGATQSPAPPPAPAEVKGDALTDQNIKLSKQRQFMVLITDNANCCKNLKAEMYRQRGDGNTLLPFFIVDANDAGEVAKAGAEKAGLNVGVDSRRDKLPWVGLFGRGATTAPTFKAEKVDDNNLTDVLRDLKAKVAEARSGMDGAAAPGAAETTPGGRPATQQDKAELQAYIDARVDEALQKRINAAEEAAKNPAAPKDSFQTYVDSRVDDSFQRKTLAALVLVGFLLLALALSAFSLFRTQQTLKSQKGAEAAALNLEPRVTALEQGQGGLISGEQLETRMTNKLINFVSKSEGRVLSDDLAAVSRAINDEQTGLLALNKKIGSARGEPEVVIEGTRVSVTTAVEDMARSVADLNSNMTAVHEQLTDPKSNLSRMSGRLQEVEGKVTDLRVGVERNSRSANILHGRLLKVEETLGKLGPQVNELRDVAVATSGALADGLTWLGNMEAARIASSGATDEVDREKAVSKLEETAERLRASAARVAPLAERMGHLVEAASERPQVSQELKDKLRGFLRDVEWFGQQEARDRQRIATLRGTSVSSRHQEFLREQGTLKEQFSQGQLTAAQFEAAYRESFNNHFSQGAADGTPVGEDAGPGNSRRVEDQLMDWFSNFSQLVSRVRGSNAAGAADGDTVEEMQDVLNVAREVLVRFDIQPEEIEIGKTAYDPRLHVLVNWRQSPYPANTVVDVQQSGFRRVRDGETLRRPQVIVAQASDGEHA